MKRHGVFFGSIILLPILSSLFVAETCVAAEKKASLIVQAGKGTERISRNIYGHFAEHLGRCIYDGIWVGPESTIPNTRGIRNDIVKALKEIRIPVLRWPGGCFADIYHWKDGVGPREQRKPILNVFWGNVHEDNSFGTHEFLDLCEQLGCEAYIAGNVGSGTVREMQQWVEYTTYDGKSPMADMRRANGRKEPWKVKYWGVGNENWGCGGNFTPEYYANVYRRFANYLRSFSGNRVFKIACGNYADRNNCQWTETVMKIAAGELHGLSIHYYCGSGTSKKLAASFDKADWFSQMKKALRLDEVIKKNIAAMDKYDSGKKVDLIVDEWGTWHGTEGGTNPRFLYQQNTLHDAVVAGLSLNIFNKHCDRVKMANIAQTVNVLQAMILTQGEKMILTPTYHVFKMYTVHHDATLLPIELECDDYTVGNDKIPSVSVSASKDTAGRIHITLCNLDPDNPVDLDCQLQDTNAETVTGRIITHDDINAHNTFDHPDVMDIRPYTGAEIEDGELTAILPSKSVIALEIK